jgi:nicotinamide-nucleotide amidase
MSLSPRCILVCVGSELLRGKLNTHASHVARRLASIGLALHEENTVSDELPEITSALVRALDRFDIILVSGGLGPTFDDLTREAAAEATGHGLKLSPPLLNGLRKKFKRARYKMPPANARQAYVMDDAAVISNAVGTAPGQWLETGEKVLILLPGPPRELYPMLETFVLPQLKKRFPPLPTEEAHLHFVGVPESQVDDKIRPIIARAARRGTRVQFTILAHLGLVDIDIFVSGPTKSAARSAIHQIAATIRKAIGDPWYGSDADYPLEKVVGDLFRRKRATLAVAESCTGGMLAARLTDIAGSSDFFVEGWVTYANAAKMKELDVPAGLLKQQGAVSKPVALAMARGIRERAGSTWGVGITGIAGPGGGTPHKPVGLVFIALVSQTQSMCRMFTFPGDRDAVRQRSVLAALDLLRQIELTVTTRSGSAIHR